MIYQLYLQLSTIPVLVTYMYIVSTGICVQVHVLIRPACVFNHCIILAEFLTKCNFTCLAISPKIFRIS